MLTLGRHKLHFKFGLEYQDLEEMSLYAERRCRRNIISIEKLCNYNPNLIYMNKILNRFLFMQRGAAEDTRFLSGPYKNATVGDLIEVIS